MFPPRNKTIEKNISKLVLLGTTHRYTFNSLGSVCFLSRKDTLNWSKVTVKTFFSQLQVYILQF